MWLYDGMWPAVEDVGLLTPKEIITWTMMHWIQGPYGPMRIYKEGSDVSVNDVKFGSDRARAYIFRLARSMQLIFTSSRMLSSRWAFRSFPRIFGIARLVDLL